MDFPPEADGVTAAISVACEKLLSGETKVHFSTYRSLSDCSTKVNPLFNAAATDGSCINNSGNNWSILAMCEGWGVKPPPPPPVQPQPGDIGVALRNRYPDRRCEFGKQLKATGLIRPCGLCIAENHNTFQKINCNTGTTKLFERSDCSGTYVQNNFKNCEGLGVIRGIFKDEIEFGPLNSYAFFSSFDGDECYAEKVVVNAGLRSGVCTPIQSPNPEQIYMIIDCSSHILSGYTDPECSGNLAFSYTFVDNECKAFSEFPAKFRASCNGYEIAPPMPQTKKPSSSPTFPTSAPSSSPTIPGETRKPTSNPKKETEIPTLSPEKITSAPSFSPYTKKPSTSPVFPTERVTEMPTSSPENPTSKPTASPKKEVSKPTTSPNREVAKPTTSPNKEVSKPTASPNKEASKPTTSPNKEVAKPTTSPNEKVPNPTASPGKEITKPTTSPSKNSGTTAPTKNPTRTCPDIQRGCTGIQKDTCKGTLAKWSIGGTSYDCNCVFSTKSSKVVFKIRVAATTVAAFNVDRCNLVDLFKGVHDKVYEKTKASIVSDFPIEVEEAATQSSNDIIVKFSILGFFEATLADEVIAYIKTNANDFIASIESAASKALGGAGVDVTLDSSSIVRVDDVSICGCEKLIAAEGSDAISKFVTSSYLAQTIIAGIAAAVANQ